MLPDAAMLVEVSMSPNHFLCRLLVSSMFAWLSGCGPVKEMPDPSVADSPPTNRDSTQSSAPEPPRKAETGVGIAGRSLQQEHGIGQMIAQPAATLFKVREKVVFEIQLPQAVALFQATEGRLPESHEEFVAKIIDANRIQLPKLPPGQTYRYRPDLGELWVEPESKTNSSP
jgi:hypothetical protein